MKASAKSRRVPRSHSVNAETLRRQQRLIELRAAVGVICEGLESRVMFTTVSWTGNAHDGKWSSASNWNPGLPGTSDDVLITVTDTITYDGGSSQVKSIYSADPFTIAGGTLTVSGTVQVNNTFTLNGGTLDGGTVLAGSGGQGITVSTSGLNRLDNVTVNADIDMTNSGGSFLRIKNGFTLNGTATLGGGPANHRTTIDFENTETMTAGTLKFISSTNYSRLNIESGAAVTLGSGVTVHGGAFYVGLASFNAGANALLNQGLISIDIPSTIGGQDQAIISSSNLSFTNQGTVQVINGGALNVSGNNNVNNSSTGTWFVSGFGSINQLGTGTDAWSNSGSITASNGGSVTLTGNGTTSATLLVDGSGSRFSISSTNWSNTGVITAQNQGLLSLTRLG